MAENKMGPNIGAGAGILAKRVQRSLSRAQEKVLQKLGKNMETRDEQFEQCSQNLIKQQTDGGRLLKDVRAYFTAVKVMHESSKRLSQTLKDVYETDWQGGEDLAVIMNSEDLLWNDYEEKLTDQLVRTMENYTGQFPEVKERVAKRGRKLVDYDSSRHHLEALQSAKKKDEAKITKAEEEFNKAQNVFEEINKELREELPVLYQSRIGCYVTVFQNISNLRDVFYKEMSVLNHELYNVMKKLETQHSGKAFIIKGLNSSTKSSKKRKSLVISAPIPCNTAFPADHISIHSASDPNDKDPIAAHVITEEPAQSTSPQRPATLPQRPSTSPQLTKAVVTPSETSDSDELSSAGASTPKRLSVCDSDEKSDATSEGPSQPVSVVQEEVAASSPSEDSTASVEEAQSQRSEVTGDMQVTPPESTESDTPVAQAEQENAPQAEPIQNAELPPVPAPRLSSHSHSVPLVEASPLEEEERDEGFQELLTNTKCTGDELDFQGPPGFLYKAVALEGFASGELQFKEGDVILVLADTEEKQEGMVRGVREESWIQHRDLADHSGIFMEKLIRPVQSE